MFNDEHVPSCIDASRRASQVSLHTSERRPTASANAADTKQSRSQRTDEAERNATTTSRQSEAREGGDHPVRKDTLALTLSEEDESGKRGTYTKKRDKGLQELGMHHGTVLLTEEGQPQHDQKQMCHPPCQPRAAFQGYHSRHGENCAAVAEPREQKQPRFDALLTPEPNFLTSHTEASALSSEGHGDTAWKQGNSGLVGADTPCEIARARRQSEIVVMTAAGENPRKYRRHKEKVRSREFKFAIGLVPQTRGTMYRPELTRRSDLSLGSTGWRGQSAIASAPDEVSQFDSEYLGFEPFGLSQLESTEEKRDADASLSRKSEKRRRDKQARRERGDRERRKRHKDEGRRKRSKKREGKGRPTDGRSTQQATSPSGALSPAGASGEASPKSAASVSGAVSPMDPDRSLIKSEATPSTRQKKHRKESSKKRSKPRRSDREDVISAIGTDAPTTLEEGRTPDKKKSKKKRRKRDKSESSSKDRGSRSDRSERKRRHQDEKAKTDEVTTAKDESPEKVGDKKTYPQEPIVETNVPKMGTEMASTEKLSETRPSKGPKRKRSSHKRRAGRSGAKDKEKSGRRSGKERKRRDEKSSEEALTITASGERETETGKSKSRRGRKSKSEQRGKSKGRHSRSSKKRSKKSPEATVLTASHMSAMDETLSGSKRSRKSGSGRSSRSRKRRSRSPETSSGTSESEMSSEGRHRKAKKRRHRHKHRKGREHHRGGGSPAKTFEERPVENYAEPSTLLMYGGLLLICIAVIILLIFSIGLLISCCCKPIPSTTTEVVLHTSKITAKIVPLLHAQPLRPKRPYHCASEYCTREALYLGGLLSHSTQPCENFYMHVCEAWMRQHPALSASTASLISQATMLQESTTRRLLDQLSRMSVQRDVQNAVNLHSACVNSNSKLPAVKDSLRWMFSHWTIGHWPRTDAPRNGVNAVWRFAAELVRDVDIPTIVRASVSVNPKELEASVVKLDRPRFLLGDAKFRANEVAGLFKQAVSEVTAELGASVPSEFGERLLKVSAALAVLGRTRYRNDSVDVRPYGHLSNGLREFLRVLLQNVRTQIRSDESVVLYSAPYFRGEVQDALQLLQPEDTLNYVGFLVLVHFAPFLSPGLASLRSLFVSSVLGRTIANTTDTSLLCAWLMDRVLPGCLAKASRRWRQSTGQEVATRDWLSQLEQVFLRHAKDFRWINERSSLLIHYRRKMHAAGRADSAPKEESACAPLEVVSDDNPLLLYRNIVTRWQNKMLGGLYRTSAALRHRWAGSELSTEASFRRAFQTVHVPAAVFNESVPASDTSFIFQLPRIAVRFYRALVQLLYENPYERHAPLRFDEEANRELANVVSCFREVSHAAAATGGSRSGKPLHKVFLDETLAIFLATKAFEELSPIRKVWNLDLRLKGLSNVTALQLLFIYFALDNCESADPAFHQSRLSVTHRVNLALKHTEQFAKAFGCDPGAPMVAPRHRACPVTRTRSHRRLSNAKIMSRDVKR